MDWAPASASAAAHDSPVSVCFAPRKQTDTGKPSSLVRGRRVPHTHAPRTRSSQQAEIGPYNGDPQNQQGREGGTKGGVRCEPRTGSNSHARGSAGHATRRGGQGAAPASRAWAATATRAGKGVGQEPTPCMIALRARGQPSCPIRIVGSPARGREPGSEECGGGREGGHGLGARLRLGCCARLARVGLFRSAKTNRHGKTVELSPGSEGSTHPRTAHTQLPASRDRPRWPCQ